MELHARGVQIFHVLELAPAVGAQIHDRAHIFRRRDEVHLRVGLTRLGNFSRVGVIERRVDLDLRAVRLCDLIDDVGRGRNEIQVILPLEPLEDDLHV